MKSSISPLFFSAACLASNAMAGPEAFRDGALIEGYGQIADVPDAAVLPKDSEFKVSWDLAKAAEPVSLNRGFDTVARFLNMHHAAAEDCSELRLDDVKIFRVWIGRFDVIWSAQC